MVFFPEFMIFNFYLVNDGTDNISTVEYPMHESAKRGNLDFVCECLKNKVIFIESF